jgi:hypothetical protein
MLILESLLIQIYIYIVLKYYLLHAPTLQDNKA